MIYKFKSKATGDTLMLGPQGDAMLRLLGKDPAPQGIIEPADMPAAIQALQRAADADAQQRATGEPGDEVSGQDPVALRQRLWPMVEMLRAAHAHNVPIVWGV